MTQPQHDHDDSLDEALLEATITAIRDAIRATKNSDSLYDTISSRLVAINNCPITAVDAHGIALQSIEDTGSDDPDSSAWDGADGEGVLNHALYHRGRPGECGPNCPAFLDQ